MPDRGFDSWAPWKWALLLVIALHLLSTSGTWWITDHGEILAVAHQFVSGEGLDLENLGPAWQSWAKTVEIRESAATRFLPLSILALVPFLLIDHAFGWRDPQQLHFVHLQGHFFTGLSLFLAGRFVARAAASSSASLCVLLAGLSWPVWMISRRLGPEPVLLLLVTALLTEGPRVRFVCLVLLPWVHASAPLLSLGAILCLAINQGTGRTLRQAALPFLLGSLSVAFLWNLPVHGHAVLGGYDAFRGDRFFTLRNPLVGTITLVGQVLAFTLPLVYLTWRGGRLVAMNAAALALPAALFFGAFSSAEPERRMAPLVAAWAVVSTSRMLPLMPLTAFALALASLASGIFGLSSDFVASVRTPLGLFSGPHLLFLRLAFEEGRELFAGAAVASLIAAAAFAASRTLSPMLPPEKAVGPNGISRPESSS